MAKKLYQVQAGETLKSIARDRLGEESRWAELAYINSLTPPYFVSPGTLLLLPSDGDPLEVVITKGQEAPERAGPPTPVLLSPAEWMVFGAGAFLLWLLATRK